MKRFLVSGVLVAVALSSIVLAQTSTQATLRTSAGDRPVTMVQQGGHTYVSAHEVITALGGTVAADSGGFQVSLGGVVAAFGPDSRFGVIRDDLLEMPVAPIVIEGKPYVPWQFFHGFLSKAVNLEAVWDAGPRVLHVRPRAQDTVDVQVSVTNVQGITKVVITLSGPADYTIIKEPGSYLVRFRTPVRAPFPERTFDDPHVPQLVFGGNDLRLVLGAPDVIADAYKLENPHRIVLDLRKGAAPSPGTLPPLPIARPVEAPGINTIVIDPGHGGKEVGAIGSAGLMEKDATLALCKKLAVAISSKLGARVILTRDDDSVVSLEQRTAIANQYKADLFLSVHMNAAVVKGARGSETYFLSLEASDELARKAAEVENAAAGSQPRSSPDLNLILWDLAQQQYLQESSRFAQAIQEEMNAVTGVVGRGVKQAPFKVLVGATMPAALVEVAFISNPEEEAKLQDEEFQRSVIGALTRALQRYKSEYETRIGLAQPAPAPPIGQQQPAPDTAPAAKKAGT